MHGVLLEQLESCKREIRFGLDGLPQEQFEANAIEVSRVDKASAQA
jgi:hypothetical protein